MLPVELLLLLPVILVASAQQRQPNCRPTCSDLLPRLPEVRRWCAASLQKPVPKLVGACVPPAGFSDAPPRPGVGDRLVATSTDYEALWDMDTRWTVCHARRISEQRTSDAYFGAVWDATANLCEQQHAIWLVTYEAPPCWQHNASRNLLDFTITQSNATSLLRNLTYQCRSCRLPSQDVSDSEKNYTYVITIEENPKLFRYSSCSGSISQPYPTLSVINTNNFTCEGCRRWIELYTESLLEYRDCDSVEAKDRLSSGTAHLNEPADEFHRICKPEPTTPPEPTTTTTSLLDRQGASTEHETTTEDSNRVPDRVIEALKELNPKTVEDAVKNGTPTADPDRMLRNLDDVIKLTNNVTLVSQSLEGFEVFAKTLLEDNATRQGQEVFVNHTLSALVVASGVVGALVSDEGLQIDLLRNEKEEHTVDGVLQMPALVGVLLPVELGAQAAAADIAVAVVRQEAFNTTKFLQKGLQINSAVISVQVATYNSSQRIDYVDIFLKPRIRGVRRRCGIWDLKKKVWDFSKCTLYRRGQVLDVYRCRHLTHFAELVTDADLQWGEHARPLELLSLAGNAASLLGVAGLGAAALLSRAWRRKPGTRVLLQLGTAVAARDMLMLVVTLDAFRPSWLWYLEDPYACRGLGVALHYTIITSIAWTTAAAVLQLLRLVTVAGVQAVVPHVVLVSAACSWLVPLAPVAALLATSGLEGGYPFRVNASSNFLCYPKGIGLYTTVVFPVALCTVFNAAIFLYLLLTVLFPSCLGRTAADIRRHGSLTLRRRLLTAVVLFFLLGLPWVLGPPARVPALAYLFCAIATPQGMALFVFFVLCNGSLRKSIYTSLSHIVSSSRAAGYSKQQGSNTTQVNDSSSDATLRRNRQKQRLRLKDDFELNHKAARF